MGQKSISQLDTISQAHDTDLFEVAAVDAQSASGYKSGKMSAEVMAEGLLSTYTYPTAMPNMQNKTITGALNQLLANFASAYDDTETYSVGDVCTYNGQLYKCMTAVSTAETFDPTKWAAIVVTELSGGHNYSTSEQVIGTWIDGKPLYEKTIVKEDIQLITSSSYVKTASFSYSELGLSNIDNIFVVTAFEVRSTGTVVRVNYSDASSEHIYSFLHIRPQSTNVFYQTNINSSDISKLVFTLRYTKTD